MSVYTDREHDRDTAFNLKKFAIMMDGHAWATALIISPSTASNLELFDKMFEQAKADFPRLRRSGFNVGNVVKSSMYKNLAVAWFRAYPEDVPEGYQRDETLRDIDVVIPQ